MLQLQKRYKVLQQRQCTAQKYNVVLKHFSNILITFKHDSKVARNYIIISGYHAQRPFLGTSAKRANPDQTPDKTEICLKSRHFQEFFFETQDLSILSMLMYQHISQKY